ncbi:hypothetical protein ACH492_38485 [Streptomyces sp. NPDC019443]|uniref:hypothetical protein n=1 Tax=Streptomyces sp. NPDC019443 TaxID=3365061 RepID=UPI0037B575D5
MGNTPRIEMAPGGKGWLTAADGIASKSPASALSIDDCGHVQGSAGPSGEHRTRPHFFRVTSAGRRTLADAA